MKTILITGGAGFIGSNFVSYIYNKYPDYKILVLDLLTYAGELENIPEEIRESERFEFWYGDINNLELVNDLVGRSDVVVHYAAETHVARSLYSNREFFVTDVLGTQAVANAVLKHADKVERMIHISTSEVYGSAENATMDEDHPLNPTSPYAAAKAGADRLVYSYCFANDLPAVIIRPFNNYGPKQHLEKVIPRFITGCIIGEPMTIHGQGLASRDWVHTEDTARAVDMVIHAPIEKVKGEVFNVGTGKDLSVLEIAKAITKEFGIEENFDYINDRFGQVQKHLADTKKTEKVLGFTTEIEFNEGLKSTIEWYKNNEEIWKRHLAHRHVPIRMKDGSIKFY